MRTSHLYWSIVVVFTLSNCVLPEYTKDWDRNQANATGASAGRSTATMPAGTSGTGLVGLSGTATNSGASNGGGYFAGGGADDLPVGGASTNGGTPSIGGAADGGANTDSSVVPLGGTSPHAGTPNLGSAPNQAGSRATSLLSGGTIATGSSFAGASGSVTGSNGGSSVTLGGSTHSIGGAELGGGSASGPVSGGTSASGATATAGTSNLSGGSESTAGQTSGGSTAAGASSVACVFNSGCVDEGYCTCPGDSSMCHTQVSVEPDNCGDCGRVCSGGNVKIWGCSSYHCVVDQCEPNWDNCDGRNDNGCEQDLSGTDPDHCGDCKTSCEYPACGTNGGMYSKAICYPITTWGHDAIDASPLNEGRAAKILQGVRRGISNASANPSLVAMGIVEMNAGVKYYLALYDEKNGAPGDLVWSSPLQQSNSTGGTPRRNEIRVDRVGGIPLVTGSYYWQMILVYNPDSTSDVASLLVEVTKDSEGLETQYGYDGMTTIPVSLADQTPVDLTKLSKLSSPATYIRVAQP